MSFSTAGPVLVVHGVDNRIVADFESTVAKLNAVLGTTAYRLIPVFWGDLGASVELLSDTLPQAEVVRRADDGEGAEAAARLLVVDTPATSAMGARRRSGSPADIAAEAAVAELSSTTSAAQRRGDDDREVRDAVIQGWNDSKWLKKVTDPGLSEAVGRTIGRTIREHEASSPARRGWRQNIKDYVSGVVDGVDSAVGGMIGSQVGKLNNSIRAEYAPGVMRFLGDAFIYQRHFAEIRRRIWDAIDRHAPGYGSEKQPIDILAHSFGGLISFDAALAKERALWIRALVTFGSQPPFFHVLDPRAGLAPYKANKPVALPATIGRWTNLWEPMDPLAFVAGKIFTLNSGAAPTDVMVPHRVSNGWWTHSCYWTTDELIQAVKSTFA